MTSPPTSTSDALVHLERCDSYDRADVSSAVRATLAATGSDLLRPGRTVLVKPNLVNPQPADEGICTHPAVVRAVAEAALEAGCSVIVGDQPTYDLSGQAAEVFAKSELTKALQDLSVQRRLLSADGYVQRDIPDGRQLTSVHVSRLATEVDVIVNVAKCKTHVQTTLTAAVKNMFGVVAPRDRMDIHAYGAYRALGEALSDTYAALPPHLSVVDGIVSMGGSGPAGGTLVATDFVAGAQDAVALDAVIEDLVGLRPGQVAVTAACAAAGRGIADLGQIRMTGHDPHDLRCKLPLPPTALRSFPPFLGRLVRPLIYVRPQVNSERCVRCGGCREVCPAKAIRIGRGGAAIDRDLCIECFCCMEACPEQAISPQRSLLARLAWRR